VFVGTLTASGLVEDCTAGRLEIIREGRFGKIVDHVQQISFSGQYARETGQEVVFVTERAVFRLEEDGIVLTEIAPGADLERDVLAHMEFRPRISEDLRLMDEELFRDVPIRLAD